MTSHTTGARSLRSGAFMVAGRVVQLTLQLGLVAVLSRILDVEDFGVQTFVFPVALIVQNIANGGLQSAIIQHPDLKDEEASALFWAALRWNLLVCGGMALSGLLLSVLYRDWVAAPMAAVWAAILYAATLSAVQEAWLKRHFRFGAVLAAQLAAMAVSVAVAIWAANAGARYWTFMIQLAVAELGRVAIIWVICPWRPAPRSTLGAATTRAVGELRAYWSGLAGSRLLAWIGEQSDRVTVAAIGGRDAAGLYEFAKRWGTFAFLEPYLALTEVAIATLSPLRSDARRLTATARSAFLPVLAAAFPVLGFLFAEPQGVLHFLFGDKWLAAAPALRVVAVAMAIGSIGRLVLWISLATGGTARQLAWTKRVTALYLACVVTGAWRGPYGAALGMLAANVLTAIPSVFYILKPTGVRPRDIFPVWLMPFAAAAAGVVVLFLLGPRLPDAMTFVGLVVRGFTFVAVYALSWALIPGGPTMLRGLRDRSVSPATPGGGSTGRE